MLPADVPALEEAFAVKRYAAYLDEHTRGERRVLVAELDGSIVGYLTIVWTSPYPPFAAAGIPEIKDLNVVPPCRRRGIATALLDAAEAEIATRAGVAGIGVGMDPDYGPAQVLYVRRGYVPDGRGLTWSNAHVRWGDQVRVDDGLVLYLTRWLSPPP